MLNRIYWFVKHYRPIKIKFRTPVFVWRMAKVYADNKKSKGSKNRNQHRKGEKHSKKKSTRHLE